MRLRTHLLEIGFVGPVPETGGLASALKRIFDDCRSESVSEAREPFSEMIVGGRSSYFWPFQQSQCVTSLAGDRFATFSSATVE